VLDYARGIRIGAWQTGPLGGVCTVLGEGTTPVSSNASGAGPLWKLKYPTGSGPWRT